MKLGFLGYGNLARALTHGLCRQGGPLTPADITVTAHTQATLDAAASAGHNTCSAASELFACCDTVVLAVKPRVFRELATELKSYVGSNHRVISVMCAVHIDEIQAALGCPVLRVMPTLAAAEACDILGYSDAAAFGDVVPLLESLGDAIPMNEAMLDRLTVTASCGLGFAAHILKSYRAECMKFGFDAVQSTAIVRRMFAYAAEYTEENGTDTCAQNSVAAESDCFAALERRVATRGGATEAGNIAMDAPLCTAIAEAFRAAGERAIPRS